MVKHHLLLAVSLASLGCSGAPATDAATMTEPSPPQVSSQLQKPSTNYVASYIQGAAGQGTRSQAYQINAFGSIAGSTLFSSEIGPRPVIWQNGVQTNLPVLVPVTPGSIGYVLGEAFSINDLGVAVGYATVQPQCPACLPATHAVLWANGGVRDLGTLPGTTNSIATGINAFGIVVGFSGSSGGTQIYSAQGPIRGSGGDRAFAVVEQRMTSLVGLPGGTASYAAAINLAGEIVGAANTPDGATHAVAWRLGRIRDLGMLPGDVASYATAINVDGTIVGASVSASGANHAVMWDDGQIREISGIAGFANNIATGINARGQIVGTSISSSTNGFTGPRAFVWYRGTATDLGVTSSNSVFSYRANAINIFGAIVGLGGSAPSAILWAPASATGAASALTQ